MHKGIVNDWQIAHMEPQKWGMTGADMQTCTGVGTYTNHSYTPHSAMIKRKALSFFGSVEVWGEVGCPLPSTHRMWVSIRYGLLRTEAALI